jgi:hypothetical protein
VNLVSLHVIDRMADLSWRGVSLVQALKLLCAALTLAGVRRARRAQEAIAGGRCADAPRAPGVTAGPGGQPT